MTNITTVHTIHANKYLLPKNYEQKYLFKLIEEYYLIEDLQQISFVYH